MAMLIENPLNFTDMLTGKNLAEARAHLESIRGRALRGITFARLDCWDGSMEVIMATEDFDRFDTMGHVYVAYAQRVAPQDGGMSWDAFWAEVSQFDVSGCPGHEHDPADPASVAGETALCDGSCGMRD